MGGHWGGWAAAAISTWLLAACGGGATPSPADPTDAALGAVTDAGSDDTAETAAGSDAAPEAGAPDAADAADTIDAIAADPHLVRVMTYNVMCPFCVNGDHLAWPQDWSIRAPMVRDTIARFDPDLIGLQETFTPDTTVDMLGDVTTADGVYDVVYYVKKPTDPATALGDDFATYSDAAILYRKSRFVVLDQGAIWLSPTPDIAYSNGFAKGGQLPRLMYWARLQDKLAQRTLVFASTHFDNNTPSQKLSAPLALARFAPMAAKEPLIFVGDFNSTPTSEAYAILAKGVDGKGFRLDNAFDLAAKWQVDSNRSPKPDYDVASRIDHIWLAGATFAVPEWHVDLHAYGDLAMWPSDHDPMVAWVRW